MQFWFCIIGTTLQITETYCDIVIYKTVCPSAILQAASENLFSFQSSLLSDTRIVL